MKQKINLTPEQLSLWLAALRSGEYKQTTKKLVSICDDGTAAYCCLGVLCETNKLKKDDFVPEEICYYDSTMTKSSDSLYPNVLCEYGDGRVSHNPSIDMTDFPDIANKYKMSKCVLALYVLNDSYKVSFVDIATLIDGSFEACL